MRQQRQCPGLIADIAQHQVHQPGCQLPAAAPGRLLDGRAQLLGRHCADVALRCGTGVAQCRVGREERIEVGAQGDEDRRPVDVRRQICRRLVKTGGICEGLEEGRLLGLIAAQREDLFELVDRQQCPAPGIWPRRRRRPQRQREGSWVCAQLRGQRAQLSWRRVGPD